MGSCCRCGKKNLITSVRVEDINNNPNIDENPKNDKENENSDNNSQNTSKYIDKTNRPIDNNIINLIYGGEGIIDSQIRFKN